MKISIELQKLTNNSHNTSTIQQELKDQSYLVSKHIVR